MKMILLLFMIWWNIVNALFKAWIQLWQKYRYVTVLHFKIKKGKDDKDKRKMYRQTAFLVS